eukprot:g1542.t1
MFSQHKSTKTKKLVITGLKVKPHLPLDFEQVTWMKLKHAVHAVHQQRPLGSSLEELYRCVEDMCIHHMSSGLYDKLERECDEHITQSVASLKEKLFLDPVQFLNHMEEVWERHCNQMKKIGLIFLYLDRSYVLNSSSVKSLFEMGLRLFCQHLSNLPEVEMHTLNGILMMIETERSGFPVDRLLLKNLLNMFSLLGLYGSHFQGSFLEKTRQFYEEESEKNVTLCDVPAYLLYCEKRLAEEHDRSEHYLDRSTQRPLLQCVEEQLLCARMDTILTAGFYNLMDMNQTDDLARLFNLCKRIQALNQLNAYLRSYIKDRGDAIMSNEENNMVLMLLDFKEKLDHVLAASFQVAVGDKNNEFQQSLKDGFEKFINKKESKPAELTAKFIDSKLRIGAKGQTEEDLELILDKILTIFRFIQGKDVFEAFYKSDLAKRLLMNKSASIDAEKSMISKLREECGSKFTNKFEGMFKDMEISKDIMTSFRSSAEATGKISNLTSDMNVLVLTCGIWPSYPIIDARLPNELEQCKQIFEEFYLQKHNGRRLQWHNSLSTCILKAKFTAGPKELQVSILQATVLFLFNDVDSLIYKDIEEGTGIPSQELKRLLQSLSSGKMKVLLKTPSTKDINPDDEFSFASDFTDAHYRIRLNAFQMKETTEENTKVNDAIMQDRQYQIDAAIVRIMKMRNTLSHKLLINELMTQLKFSFKTVDIKKRIESLIERDYMDRAADDPSVRHLTPSHF